MIFCCFNILIRFRISCTPPKEKPDEIHLDKRHNTLTGICAGSGLLGCRACRQVDNPGAILVNDLHQKFRLTHEETQFQLTYTLARKVKPLLQTHAGL